MGIVIANGRGRLGQDSHYSTVTYENFRVKDIPNIQNTCIGSGKKIMKVFQNLVGAKAFPCVALASTVWQHLASDPIAYEIAVQHQAEFKSEKDFWGPMCGGGSKFMRWDGSRDSALAMVDFLSLLQSKCGTAPLLIHRER
jgi:hypothetical protein